MEQNIKPKYLYRGIVLPYDKLENFNLTNIDLVVPYDPILDEKGNKVVLDGNEYGVYMSDNQTMVSGVYGDLHNDGKPIRDDITIGSDKKRILIPSIGISYKIDTQGIAVRKPVIASSLKGHYNNGFQGDEWIADKIPSSNYQVSRIRIGADILHEAEDIPIIDGNVETAKIVAIHSIEMRKYRLDSLVYELSKMTATQRFYLDNLEFNVLKSIYGLEGIRYMTLDSIDDSNNIGRIKKLMVIFYNKGNGIIDFNTLCYIEGLKQKLSKLENSNSIGIIEQIISEDIKTNEQYKTAFIKRKSEEDVKFSTDSFDKKNQMLFTILQSLSSTKEKRGTDDFDERKVEMENYNAQRNSPGHKEIKPSAVDEKARERERQIANEYQRLSVLEEQAKLEEEQDQGMSM